MRAVSPQSHLRTSRGIIPERRDWAISNRRWPSFLAFGAAIRFQASRPSAQGNANMDFRRPPVLAHQRFVADRASFEGLDLASRFDRIVRTNMWGAETSVSGLGSGDTATAAVQEVLPDLLDRIGAQSLLDAPCGDAGWIRDCALGASYTGMDIVPSLIAANTAQAERGEFAGRFLVADMTKDVLPYADVILCRDCLVHLSFANIHRATERMHASGARWVIATTFPEWEINHDCEDGDWRALNLQRPPFCWPAPQEMINERCTEGGGGWSDKSLGLWRLSDLLLGPHARQTRMSP